jgi:Olfactomedin-like domain
MIGKPLFHRYTSAVWGTWMTESSATNGEVKIWMTRHYTGSHVSEYQSMEDFVADKTSYIHELSEPFHGTGHVVYKGSLYYHKAGSDEILRYVMLCFRFRLNY